MKRPTPAELQSALTKTMPDLIAPDLKVLFCGINPSLYSAYVGFHFARPGNRFWSTLYAGGFTSRLLKPAEEAELLRAGYGITSLVARPTVAAAELTSAEIVLGGQQLLRKVAEYRPKVVGILGITVYRTAFNRPRAVLGRQAESLGSALLWVLPNPSGLNAHYKPADFARIFGEFRLEVEALNRVQSP